MLPEYKTKAALCDIARYLAGKDLFAFQTDVLSLRGGASFWCTPQDAHPVFLTPDQLLRADSRGRVYGRGKYCEKCIDALGCIYAREKGTQAVFLLRGEAIRGDDLQDALLRAEEKQPENREIVFERVIQRVTRELLAEGGDRT